MFYLCSNNFYYFMLYHSSALEFIIERYISIVYYYYYYYYLDTRHLIGKVRLKNKQKSYHIGSCQDIIELCEIRDGLESCYTLSNDDVCKLIDIICLECCLISRLTVQFLKRRIMFIRIL